MILSEAEGLEPGRGPGSSGAECRSERASQQSEMKGIGATPRGRI
jgi:hypothetical protein